MPNLLLSGMHVLPLLYDIQIEEMMTDAYKSEPSLKLFEKKTNIKLDILVDHPYNGFSLGIRNNGKILGVYLDAILCLPTASLYDYVESRVDDVDRYTIRYFKAESAETPRAYMTPSSVADSSKSRSEKMHGAMTISKIMNDLMEALEHLTYRGLDGVKK
ncbi:hypothetical protein Tco_0948096 [Tanacetum coccineum]